MKYLLGFAILCFCMYIQAEEGEEDSREGRSMHFQIKVSVPLLAFAI